MRKCYHAFVLLLVALFIFCSCTYEPLEDTGKPCESTVQISTDIPGTPCPTPTSTPAPIVDPTGGELVVTKLGECEWDRYFDDVFIDRVDRPKLLYNEEKDAFSPMIIKRNDRVFISRGSIYEVVDGELREAVSIDGKYHTDDCDIENFEPKPPMRIIELDSFYIFSQGDIYYALTVDSFEEGAYFRAIYRHEDEREVLLLDDVSNVIGMYDDKLYYIRYEDNKIKETDIYIYDLVSGESGTLPNNDKLHILEVDFHNGMIVGARSHDDGVYDYFIDPNDMNDTIVLRRKDMLYRREDYYGNHLLHRYEKGDTQSSVKIYDYANDPKQALAEFTVDNDLWSTWKDCYRLNFYVTEDCLYTLYNAGTQGVLDSVDLSTDKVERLLTLKGRIEGSVIENHALGFLVRNKDERNILLFSFIEDDLYIVRNLGTGFKGNKITLSDDYLFAYYEGADWAPSYEMHVRLPEELIAK